MPRIILLACLCIIGFVDASPAAAVEFSKDVAPLIVKRCLECHNARQSAGGLNLTTKAGFLKGGESGQTFDARKPKQSYLLERLKSGEMPPPRQGKSQKLSPAEIAIFEAWLADGGQWPKGRVLDLYESTSDVRGGRDWWSFQPIKKPTLPAVPFAGVNPIDRFVWAKLSNNKMQPARRASRRELIRRLYFDLIGMPPTYEQVEGFLADDSENAFEKLVDRLLESPHFGERWARYWLDLVRFAETCGYERDQEKPKFWMYRDWVVKAFNSDMPYDQFVTWQLAGDEIPNRTQDSVVATGMLLAGTWNDEPNDINEYQYDRLEDLVHVTSSAFLGLTVKCARCHDHKFDPIPQLDYYRLANAFWSGSVSRRGRLGGPTVAELGMDVFGWTDLSRVPRELRLLKNGDPKQPLEVVAPGHLTVVPSLVKPIDPAPQDSKTTTLRLQLARWITNPKNPLTPRVLVNRLWQHHFGQALVRSPNNFGFRGAPPTHPKLLDWLASELVEGEWRMKRIHKLIVMSETWQQSSVHQHARQYEHQDFTNTLLWRANRRRLDAEALRDSMLVASRQMDLNVGGASFKPTISDDALEGLSKKQSAWTASPKEQQLRRSLYIYTKRHLLPPMMTTFDFCDTTLPCGQRDVTIVPTQALALLNNHFPHERSSALAERILKSTKRVDEQVRQAWQHTLARDPNPRELAASISHVRKQRAHFTGKVDHQSSGTSRTIDVKDNVPVTKGLVLSLRADDGIKLDANGRVTTWQNRVNEKHTATQPIQVRRPVLVKDSPFAHPTVFFDGQRRFLHLPGQLQKGEACTLVAVANDLTKQHNHRSIISNWNGAAGNSTTSQFLGLTGEARVRFSDNFVAGNIVDRTKPFALFALNGSRQIELFQNNQRIAYRGNAQARRRLDTPWVIGQQGNIDGEYWHGHIAEILVYNRAVSIPERELLWRYLQRRYALKELAAMPPVESPEKQALASLCHVLMNSNEFIFVD